MKYLLPILFTLAPLVATSPTFAVAGLDTQFEGVDVENKLGEMVDVNIPLMGPDGRQMTLADFLDGPESDANQEPRPVLLTLNYYRCESICSVQLNELVRALASLRWSPGAEKFRIVTVSFDPSDTVEIAAGKQQAYRVELARMLAEKMGDSPSEEELHRRAESIDWTFLVAREKAIRALTANLGYWVQYDEASRQYAHSPVVYLLSSTGMIASYLWGTSFFPPQEPGERLEDQVATDLRLALIKTGNGVIGTFGEKLLASCFVFENGRYEFAWIIMRIGGSAIALAFGLWLFSWWRRDRRKQAHEAALMTPALGPQLENR